VPQAEVPDWLLRARAGLNLMPERTPLVQQTSTKVLEYLAVGLPVLSNDYLWARQAAARWPDRIRLVPDTSTPEAWTNAMQCLPAVLTDRSAWRTLTWPAVLQAMPVWSALGLNRRRP
jgi:glycosyltransferase involved in cell wall biosynthesis